MRKSKRDEIARSVAVQTKLDTLTESLTEWLNPVYGKLTQLDAKVEAIQPARVDLTQEMADDIVRKIHGPLTISKEFSQWIAEQGKFSDFYYTFPIGYGSDAGRGDMRMKRDGSLYLQLCDMNGATLWCGTFVPPDFGKDQP